MSVLPHVNPILTSGKIVNESLPIFLDSVVRASS